MVVNQPTRILWLRKKNLNCIRKKVNAIFFPFFLLILIFRINLFFLSDYYFHNLSVNKFLISHDIFFLCIVHGLAYPTGCLLGY